MCVSAVCVSVCVCFFYLVYNQEREKAAQELRNVLSVRAEISIEVKLWKQKKKKKYKENSISLLPPY